MSDDDIAVLTRVETTWLSDVEPVRVRWAWHKRIPLGALTILAGQPGLGKSTVTAELAARLSLGELEGDLESERTLFATFEDSAAHVVRPRVELAGGDVSKVGVVRLGGGDLLTLPHHVDALAAELERTGARLLVIDPLVAAISDTVDSNRDASVRRVLAPIAAMSERLCIATVAVMHFNKSQAELLLRIGGSIGFMGQARSALVVMEDPEAADDDDSRRLLAHIKSNYAPKQPALACELRSETMIDSAGEVHEMARMVIVGESAVTIRDLERARVDDGADSGDLQGAILDALSDGKAHPPREVKKKLADENGCSWKKVQRAAEALEAEGLIRREGPPRTATWIVDRTSPSSMSTNGKAPEMLGETDCGQT